MKLPPTSNPCNCSSLWPTEDRKCAEDLQIHGASAYLAVLLPTLAIVVPKTCQLVLDVEWIHNHPDFT